jgi:hypothetical protein
MFGQWFRREKCIDSAVDRQEMDRGAGESHKLKTEVASVVKNDLGSGLDKPIFVVGSGRSGTTILYRLLTGHPDLAWVSRLTDRFPRLPQLAMLSNSETLRRSRMFQPSTDSVNVYDYCGLTTELLKEKGGSLTERDATSALSSRILGVAKSHCKWTGKPRFINKSTMNTMRIRLIKGIFPDALFVHIIRNGYGVANSLSKVKWWPKTEIWWENTTPEQWEKEGRNPYELCAMNWKRQVKEILRHRDHIPVDQYTECRYEDLMTDPKAIVKDVLRFCKLEWNDRFEKHVASTRINAANKDKWRAELDESAKRAIRESAGDLLAELGYGSA